MIKLLLLALIPLSFCVDRILKLLVLHKMSPGESIPVWPGVFHISYVYNTGAAFGMFKGRSSLLGIISVAFILALAFHFFKLFFYAPKEATAYRLTALALILGGAISNFYDRIFYGYVVDFIDLRVWPVFNIGDLCISVGVVMLVFHILFPARSEA